MMGQKKIGAMFIAILAVTISGMLASFATAAIILQDDFTGAANSSPDGTKWDYAVPSPNPRVFRDGSGKLKIDADVSPYNPWINALGGGAGSYGFKPDASNYARLTISGLNHTLGGFGSAGLTENAGNANGASEILLRTAASPHVWYLRVAGGGDGATWNTDVGKLASTGDWVIEWYPGRVLVYYNGDLKVDTNNAPTATEGATWAFPSGNVTPVITKYGGDYTTVDAVTWESVPEPSCAMLVSLAGLACLRRRSAGRM